ncbi:MAG: circadian clock protein KaiB [Chthoniobacter sp.]|nr:circadian clock protein KaiB [Chthoniobacter sp.]
MSKPAHFIFRLYVAGDGPHSVLAIANLDALCREQLPERHQIEVVDVFREPHRALADGVVLTPLLMRLSPTPIRKLIGTLSQRDAVVRALDLTL